MVLLVGVVGAVNASTNQYLAHYGTNLGYRMVAAKYDLLAAQHGAEPVDWLILGDSSAAHGVVPSAWTEHTGGTSLNLAVVADLLVANDAWMLAEYLEHVGSPKNVVLVHAHDIWRRGYNSALIGQIPRSWGIWSRRAPQIELLEGHTQKAFYSHFLPLMSQSSTLRAHLKNRGPTRTIDLRMTERGWIPGQPHTAERVERDRARTTQRVQEQRFRMSSHNTRALEVLRTLADEHGFQLYITHGPMLDTMAEAEPFQAYVAEADQHVQALVGASDRVTVVPDMVRFPAESMETTIDHVIPSVAPAYTRQLAALVSGVGEPRAPGPHDD